MSDPVAELLRTKGIYFTFSGQDYVTKCFNPSHLDSHPSFRIDKNSGIAHCFSCGFRTNIFKFYGILTNTASIKIHKLKDKIAKLREVDTGIEAIPGSKPIGRAFRGCSLKTLTKFEAFTTDHSDEVSDRIFFPIKDIRDKVVAYVGRHQHSDSNPKYLVYPKGASTPPFPAKLDGYPKAIVLVEGMFDMLNMYEHGARNIVCTFGTVKMLSNISAKLLPYKVMGVEKVFLLFDGDTAGQEAAAKTLPLIQEAGFLCENIPMEDMDPGQMSAEQVRQIIEYTK